MNQDEARRELKNLIDVYEAEKEEMMLIERVEAIDRIIELARRLI